jgi:isopenicillin N synthase-like dioxygenase
MIPLLDLQHAQLDQADGPLARACESYGFFYLSGHDIPLTEQKAVLTFASEFFAQTLSVKNQIRRTKTNSWGYFDAELTKNQADWKEILDIGPATKGGPLAGSFPQWPQTPGFRACLDGFRAKLHDVAIAIMSAIVKTISPEHIPPHAFTDHSSFIRLNHYPPCPDPVRDTAPFIANDGKLGISHHTDSGAVTVLLQDSQPGLQVYNGNRWQTLIPPAGALIINVGDIVQVWSNDLYRAPVHRVLAHTTKTRLSLPYFLNPAYDYNYAPLETDVPRYKPINWGEFRSKRSAGDYADLGSEVQISDYRLDRV